MLQANGGASSYTDLLAEAPDMSTTAATSFGNGGANSFGGPPGGQFGGQQGGQPAGQYGAQQGAQYGQGGQPGAQQPTGIADIHQPDTAEAARQQLCIGFPLYLLSSYCTPRGRSC